MTQYTYSNATSSPSRSQGYIDLRSDTVTQPTAAMKQAMLDAPLGDDVFDEDPTVAALESRLAGLLNKEAALFFPSGTQSNLVALLSHCQRGDEVLVGDQYHTFIAEARGASVLGGVSLHPLTTSATGALEPQRILANIKPDNIHYPVTRLLALENTVSGCIQPTERTLALAQAAHAGGLNVHMDGARLFNAAVALGRPVSELVTEIDSVSICLSKGLGAPAGSVLVGSRALIHQAKRQRKILGGGMRQSGMLAAAGLYALEHHVERLADDHAHARQIGNALAELPGLEVDMERLQTNMFFIKPRAEDLEPLIAFMAENGVRMLGSPAWIRCVVHLDISAEAVGRLIELFQTFYRQRRV